MFQVQSQPASPFSMPMDRATHAAPPPSINMPRSLARPPFMDVDRNTIAAIAPELADVPIEYIRQHLVRQANEYVASLCVFRIAH